MRSRLWIGLLAGFLILALGFPAWAGSVQLHGSIVRFMSNVHVREEQVVNGDVVAVGGSITVNGQVRGSTVAVGGNVTVGESASVTGDAVSVLGTLYMQPGAQVMGNQVSILGSGPTGISGIRMPPVLSWLFDPARRMVGILFNLVLAVLVAALFPRQVERVKGRVTREPGLSALIGLVGYVVGFPLMVIFAVTIIGIPLALALGVGLWAGRLLGYTAIVFITGEAVFHWAQRTTDKLLVVAVGVILLGVVTSIPLMGWLVSLGVSLVALGAALMSRFGTRDVKEQQA